MLVAQGATAVDIWNESQLRTPRDVMRRAAEQQLMKRRSSEVSG
jgi:shikimate 5-dehydrogenase